AGQIRACPPSKVSSRPTGIGAGHRAGDGGHRRRDSIEAPSRQAPLRQKGQSACLRGNGRGRHRGSREGSPGGPSQEAINPFQDFTVKTFFDTSVLVAALIESHPFHWRAQPWLDRALSGEFEWVVSAHALAECYAVLTVLPVTPRLSPDTAYRLVHD